MKVRLTRPAFEDLQRIHAYISRDNPVPASRVVTRLIDRALALAHAPFQGREVDEPNVRVIVVPRYRYFIFYTIDGDEIHITHLRHTSRRRPWDVE
jgi:toxin ParE1/3/4